MQSNSVLDNVKPVISLAFVGETGSGKTTLLHSLRDKMENLNFMQRRLTPKPMELGKSQTKDCLQYTLANDNVILNVIDTPGLGDTEGIQTDETHLKGIVDFLIDKSEFNAICFVLKAGTNRATIHIQYVVTELKSMLPKDAANNFIVCLTNSDVPLPTPETLAVVKQLGLPEDNIILIDNKAYQDYPYDSTKPKGKAIENMLRNSFTTNFDNLQLLIDTAATFKPYKSNGIKELKKKRDYLREQVAIYNHQIDDCISVQNQFLNIIKEIDFVRKDIDSNKDYVIKSKIERKFPYKKDGKVTTNCNICNKACHIDCSLSYGDDLVSCSAMSGNTCRKCGCSSIDHTHLGWNFQLQYEDIFKDDDHKKQKLDTATKSKENLDQKLEELKRQIAEEEKKKENFRIMIQDLYKQITEIALVGHNHVYEQFLDAQLKQIEKSDKPKEFIEKKKSYLEHSKKIWKNFLESINV